MRIVEYNKNELKCEYVIVGLPEVGLVGTIASSYMIQSMELNEIGYVDFDIAPQVIVVHESRPRMPIRLLGKDDIAVLVSDVPIPPRGAIELSNEIVKWAKGKNCKMLIGFTGIPSRERMQSETEPDVFALTNKDEIAQIVKQKGIKLFDEGMLVGSYASLLKQCIVFDAPNLTLLAESYLEFPDPGAAASILKALSDILSIKIDVKPLLAESEEIRLRMRELMRRTQQAMQRVAEQPAVYA